MIALLATMLVALLPAADLPRAARSVHLSYIADKCDVFYSEMSVERSTRGSYFMACGFSGGYFGIQELVDGKKIAIFSVWDSSSENNAEAVPAEKRVQVIFQNKQAKVQRFGGEGSGVQCLLPYDWEANHLYSFAVRATKDGDGTNYAAYISPRRGTDWKHVATLRARSSVKSLTGLYSFIEDFRRDTRSANEPRHAIFANGWTKLDGTWKPLAQARFTASNADWEAKDTINAGVSTYAFFLETGGETKQQVNLRDVLKRVVDDSASPPVVPED